MKISMRIGAALSAVVLLAGCGTATVTTEAPWEGLKTPEGYEAAGVGHASNYGYYLFYYLPLFSGNDGRPNCNDYYVFKNGVTPRRNENMLHAVLKRRYKAEKLYDLRHEESSYGWFSLWTVWNRRCESSAIGIRRPKPDKKSKKTAEAGADKPETER